VIQGLVELDACTRLQTDVDERAELPENGTGTSEWVAIAQRGINLRGTTFWNNEWAAWQQEEMKRSTQSLNAAQAVATQEVDACVGIADYYKQSDQMYELFGPTANHAAPSAPCGRCPACRYRGVAPPDDPPPDPPQAWPLTEIASTHLAHLTAAAGARNGLVLLTTQDNETTAPMLARALVRCGVRHLAGPVGNDLPDLDWFFRDPEPVSPTELTPCSSFVVYPKNSHVSSLWLLPEERAAPRRHVGHAVDVLLVELGATVNGRLVGQDLPALDAWTALEILRS
jgi:hypothetical protein